MSKEGWKGQGKAGFLLVDVIGFAALVQSCFGKVSRGVKRARIKKILNGFEWVVHYFDKDTGKRVLAECELDYEHERSTAVFLAQMGYDVVFAPKGMFGREDKKFDVFLIRDTNIIQADLKCITSKNPDTIAIRIKGGSEQAPRIVINIVSNVGRKDLINGLRSGVIRNKLIKEILLIYKGKLYKLPTAVILKKDFSL